MKTKLSKILLLAGIVGIAVAIVATMLWFHAFHHYTPREAMEDVHAGIAARHIKDPEARVKRFLEMRYGSLTNPANREKAFLDFFNVDHIKSLNYIVNNTSPSQKAANTQAMAQWIADYRNSMSPEEKAALKAQLDSDASRAMIQQASAQFNSQDVYYRGAQKPVMTELLTTLTAIREQ
jgi:hypothetical protein